MRLSTYLLHLWLILYKEGLFHTKQLQIAKAMLQTTGVVFVSTELLTCSHIRNGSQIEHSLLQWLSVNGPRCWWDYNYVGLHLFITIESMKIQFHSTNHFVWIGLTCNQFLESHIEHSLLQWLSVNRPRCWWDYNYVGLHLFMSIESVKDSALQLNYAVGRFVTVVVWII